MFRVSAWLDVCAFCVSGSNPACYFASSNFAQVVCGLIDAAMESALSTPRGAAKHASREAEASGAAEHAGATKTKVTHLTDIVRVFEPVQGEPDADSIREAAVVLLSGKQGDLRRLCSKPSRSTASSRNWGVSLRDRLSGAIRKDADIRKELEKKVLAAARKYLSSVGAAEQASNFANVDPRQSSNQDATGQQSRSTKAGVVKHTSCPTDPQAESTSEQQLHCNPSGGAAEHASSSADPTPREAPKTKARLNTADGDLANLQCHPLRCLLVLAQLRFGFFLDGASWSAFSGAMGHMNSAWWFPSLFPEPNAKTKRALRWLQEKCAEAYVRACIQSLAEWETLLQAGSSREQRRELWRRHSIAMPYKKERAGRDEQLAVVRAHFLSICCTASAKQFALKMAKGESGAVGAGAPSVGASGGSGAAAQERMEALWNKRSAPWWTHQRLVRRPRGMAMTEDGILQFGYTRG